MTMTANLADGRVLNFPDGTDPQVIQATVKRLMSESQPEQAPERSTGEQVVGGLENIASLVSGAIAEPIAGLAGIGAQIGESLGLADQGAATRTIEAVREAATFAPRTETGQEQQQAIGEALAPVAEALGGAEDFLGDTAFELTGSPAIAAAAKSLPTAVLEILGFKGSKTLTRPAKGLAPSKKLVTESIVESAPEIEQLKQVSRSVYKEIDDAGVTVKAEAVDRLINDIEKSTRKAGLDPRTTPRAAGALDVIKDDLGNAQTLTEIDRLRTVAQGVAKNLDPTEKALGSRMIAEIDDFLDNARPTDFTKGTQGGAEVAKKFNAARKIWGRARRAEVIQEALKTGGSRAAGAEAGIRNELNRILNNKKLKKFFPKEELKIMRAVVDGDFKQNMTRLIGKVGLSIDRSPNVFASIVAGGGLGTVIGGTTGAIVVPVIGTISKQIAKKLTTNKANFVDAIVRAGGDAERIAKAYLTIVPKAKRNISDLADLFSDPDIDISVLENVANQTVKDALEIAKGRRAINLAAAATTGAALPKQEQQ